MDLNWSEERVRRLLSQAQQQSQDRVLLGARLGLTLRRLDPGFHPGVLGDSGLRHLLARFPDVGLVESEPGTDFRFVFRTGQVGANLPPVAGLQEKSVPEQDLWLEQQLWLGMTQRLGRERRYIDMQTQRIVVALLDDDGRPGPPVLEEPERYLLVPVLSAADLRPAAQAFVGRVTREHVQSALSGALAQEEDWLPRFQRTLEQAGLLTEWRVAFRVHVAMRAREWLERHHLPIAAFVRRRSKPAAARAPSVTPAPSEPTRTAGISRRNIRPLILQAIARMSDEELLGLNIPLRYLVTSEDTGSET